MKLGKSSDQYSAGLSEITAPGARGEFGVLPGHTPFVAALKPGVLRWKAKGGKPGVMAVGAGYAEVSGKDRVTSAALHAVRTAVVKRPGTPMLTDHAFLWIVDFPLFEADESTGQRVFAHHPFTSPHPEDLQYLETEPDRCRALHYDAVYNGNELGSGSIRITDPIVQQTVFRLLGIPADEQQRRFGFLLDALASGAPPHGGFAFGFDRVAMFLAGAASLRDVIAFPKTTAARALFEGAPVPVPPEDLKDLHLTVLS